MTYQISRRCSANGVAAGSGRYIRRGFGRRRAGRLARLRRPARSHQLGFGLKPVFLILSGSFSIFLEDRIGHPCDLFVCRSVI